MENTPHIGLETESIAIFTLFAIAGLLIDLWAHRADKPISLKAATFWSLFWVAVGASFGGFMYIHFSPEVASLYFAGYAFEMALSVDNLFAIMAVFAWFGIKSGFTHRVLYWGGSRRCCLQTYLCFNWYWTLLFRRLCRIYLCLYGCPICTLND